MYEEYLYKEELLNTFSKDNQLVDQVKLQLRQKIIHKLKNQPSPPTVPTQLELIQKVCISLFMDYLQAHRLLHSASVFAPESGFSKANFGSEELQSLFRVDLSESKSILEAIIKQVMPKGRLQEKRVETSMQTDDKETIQNLQNKLSQIEFSFKQKVVMGMKNVEDSEARFLKYKNDLNKRYKDDLDAELVRIRNFEIANIRMEEQEKSKIKMREYQEQVEMNYKNKMEKLREREAEVIQRVANKMKEIETYNFQARQRMLRDLESVKAREEEIDKIRQNLEERERNFTRNK